MAETKKLVGADGAVGIANFGTLIEGDGVTPLEAGLYVISTVADVSGLPEGAEPKVIFEATDDTGTLIIPEEGDSVYPFVHTPLCDIRTASVESTFDEIDVTTLCDADDGEYKYRRGFKNSTGSFEGITIVGVSERLLKRFFTFVTQSADKQTLEVSKIEGSNIYLYMELNKQSTGGESLLAYIAPVILISTGLNIDLTAEQAFTMNFRIAPDDKLMAQIFEREVA